MEKMKEARVAIESFRPYYDHIMLYALNRFQHVEKPKHGLNGSGASSDRKASFNPVFHVQDFCAWSGLAIYEYESLKRTMEYRQKQKYQTISLSVVDRLMTAYGIPDQVHSLYLVTVAQGRATGMSYAKYERELCLAA